MKRLLFIILILLFAFQTGICFALDTKVNWVEGTIDSGNILADAETTDDTFGYNASDNTNPPSGCSATDPCRFVVSACTKVETCTTKEIITVSAVSGASNPYTLTILARNQESTTHSGDWGSGSYVYMNSTAETFNELIPKDPTASDGCVVQYDGSDYVCDMSLNIDSLSDTVTWVNTADETKVMSFDLSGITTATTRTFTPQDKDCTLMCTEDTTWSGNSATATALAANGTNCSAGQAPLGVDASGNAEGCWTPDGGWFEGWYNPKADYNAAGVVTTTTGSITTGTNDLTVASGDGWTTGMGIAIEGAGGLNLSVEDCEDAWNESVGGSVTSAVDGTIKQVGSYSARLTVAAGQAADTILATEVVSKDLSAGAYIGLWVRSSVTTYGGDLQLLLDNTANCASPLETISLPALTANTWKYVRLYMTTPASASAIISIGIKQTRDIGAFILYIDDVYGLKELVCDKTTVSGTSITLLNSDDSDCNATSTASSNTVHHDDTYDFQQCADAGNCFVPSGSYNITSPITLSAFHILEGAGMHSTYIYNRRNTDMIQSNGLGIMIRDLFLSQDSTVPASAGAAIHFGDTGATADNNYTVAENIRIQRTYKGLYFQPRIIMMTIKDIFLIDIPGIAIHLSNPSPYGDIHFSDINAIQCNVAACNRAYGIVIDQGDLNTFVNTKIINYNYGDLWISASENVIISQRFVNISLEGIQEATKYFAKIDATNEVRGISFEGGEVGGYSASNVGGIYIGDNVLHTTINGMEIKHQNGYGININGDNTVVDGSAFYDNGNDHVYIGATGINTIISDNSFKNGSAYGVNVHASATKVNIQGNAFDTNTSGAINATPTAGYNIFGNTGQAEDNVFFPVTDSTTYFQVYDANGGTPVFNIDSTNERVGIGTSSPSYTLHVAGSIYSSSTFYGQSATPGFWLDETDASMKGAYFVLNDKNWQLQRRTQGFGAYEGMPLQVHLDAPTDSLKIDSDGSVKMSSLAAETGTTVSVCYNTTTDLLYYGTCGGYTADTVINRKPYEHGLDYILKLNPYVFDEIDSHSKEVTEKDRIGLIADEMPDERLKIYEKETGLLGNYDEKAIVATLINAIKELKAEIDELKKECND